MWDLQTLKRINEKQEAKERAAAKKARIATSSKTSSEVGNPAPTDVARQKSTTSVKQTW